MAAAFCAAAMRLGWLRFSARPSQLWLTGVRHFTTIHALPSGGLQRSRAARAERCLVLARASSGSSKARQSWACKTCGEQYAQWVGHCRACGEYGSLEKVTMHQVDKGGGGGARAAERFMAGRWAGSSSDDGLSLAAAKSYRQRTWVKDAEAPQRLKDVSQRGYRSQWRLLLPGDNGRELGRVLGGGVVPGSLTLVGGEPGVGKSTLLLQMAAMLTEAKPTGSSPVEAQERAQDVQQPPAPSTQQEEGGSEEQAAHHAAEGDGVVLYVSGEESVEQIASRAERMGPAISSKSSIYIYSTTRLDAILEEIIKLRPAAVIIDSIQTVYLDEIGSSAGSVVQVRECTTALNRVAKAEKIPIFLVGHVTKSGEIAGPRVLEHIVDTVIYMEGGRQQPVRLVRSTKNRFGNTDEIGVFEMHDDGMQVVPNPSALFLSNRDLAPNVSSAVAVVLEGTRPLLMEVQALCSPVPHGSQQQPARYPSGVNRQRLALILAVLGKHAEMRPYSVDVHLNVTGGLEMNEPAADLAVACAIASSYYEQPISHDVVLIGEVGLGGELRPVGNIERRISEAAKLGFKTFVIPGGSHVHGSSRLKGARLIECKNVVEAFRAVLGTQQQELRP